MAKFAPFWSLNVWLTQGELSFRQSPTFHDCFPGSEKCYKEIEHNGSTLRVQVLHMLHIISKLIVYS